jgi:DNA polymerase-3 subunit beta
MKFAVERDAFLRAAAQCARVVNSKSAMPVLTNARVATIAGGLEFYATDLITTVHTRVPAAVEKPGAACLPARTLLDTVQAMVPGQVLVQVDERHRAVFKSGRRKAEIGGMSADDYPALIESPSTWVDVPSAVLTRLLSTVVHAMRRASDRPHLSVVFLRTSGSQLLATTTDGHRLAHAAATIEQAQPFEVCVPAPAVDALLRDASGVETVGIAVQPKDVWLRLGETRLASKLVDGAFPAVEQVIPKSHDRRATLPRSTLLETVGALRKAVAGECLWLAFGREVLDLRVANEDGDEATAQLDVPLEGTPLKIAVEARYFAELLGALATEHVSLELGGDLDPMLFRADDPRGLAATAVVMPRRF